MSYDLNVGIARMVTVCMYIVHTVCIQMDLHVCTVCALAATGFSDSVSGTKICDQTVPMRLGQSYRRCNLVSTRKGQYHHDQHGIGVTENNSPTWQGQGRDFNWNMTSNKCVVEIIITCGAGCFNCCDENVLHVYWPIVPNRRHLYLHQEFLFFYGDTV